MKLLKPSALALSVALAFNLTACNITAPTLSTAEQVTSSPLSYVRTVEGIKEFTLENGLTILLYPDQAQPKTLVNITYNVGSVDEHYGETGMAHLLEHMLFKGSTHYKNIPEQFKKRGMSKNASTWFDRTNYFETFDANEDSLAWALGMEADRMVNGTFTKDDLQSEMTVVRNEMEKGENNPVRMLFGRMSSTAHLWHNYGNSTIGARSDVENFPFSKLREFYSKHYRPDNAVLTVAGRFDIEKTKAIIESTFGAIAKPISPKAPEYTVEPTQDGERSINIRRVGDLPYIGLMYHTPSGLHEDTAALTVLENILTDSTRGRLQKQLIKTGISTSAFATRFSLRDSSQFILVGEGTKDSELATLEKSLIAAVEDIKSNPITSEEIKLAKLALAKDAEQAMRSVTSVAMTLSEFIALGDYRHAFYSRDQVEQMTVEKVQAVAEKYLIRSNRTLGRFIPTKTPVRANIPTTPSLDEELKDYKGKEEVAPGEVFDNTVSNIKERLVELTWQEGTQVMVYPKKLRGEEILVNIKLLAGSADTLNNKNSTLTFISSMLKKGNSNYSKAQIATRLDELKSTISFSSNLEGIGIYISTDKDNFNETVKFMGELLANPTFPSDELEIMQRSSVAKIEGQRNDPTSIAINSFRKELYNYPAGHPKAYMNLDEKIAAVNAVTSKQLASLYQSQLSINNGLIAIIGDVDANEASTALYQQLSAFNNKVTYQHIDVNLKPLEGLTVSNETPDKANAKIYTINPIMMNSSHPDYLALYIANSIFGGDTFTSRIGKRIRVKEGYSYGVSSGLQVNSTDQQGLFYMQAISAPENMDALIAAYKEEMQLVVDKGFSKEELETAVAGYISSRNRIWAGHGQISRILLNNKKINRDLAFYDEQIEQLKKLTLDDIHGAFVKYIASQKVNVFKAGDFANVAK